MCVLKEDDDDFAVLNNFGVPYAFSNDYFLLTQSGSCINKSKIYLILRIYITRSNLKIYIAQRKLSEKLKN